MDHQETQEKRKPGRPKGSGMIYVPEEHYSKICAWMETGKTMAEYCRQEGNPSRSEIETWKDENADFAESLARARDIGYRAIVDECKEIADTPEIGEETEESENGKKVKRGDMLGHRKLQIETRLKLLAIWDYAKYGDRKTVDVTTRTKTDGPRTKEDIIKEAQELGISPADLFDK